jgi:hypothetical protein
MPPCHSPGGSRSWWRLWHEGPDAQLDDTHLVRLAGRSARRVRAWEEANGVPSSTARPANASTCR